MMDLLAGKKNKNLVPLPALGLGGSGRLHRGEVSSGSQRLPEAFQGFPTVPLLTVRAVWMS